MRKNLAVIWLLACVLIVNFSGMASANSLGDPFDGTDLKNPDWQWQSEPDVWDIGKTEAGWLHFVPKVNQNLWQSDTTIRLFQETNLDQFDVETHMVMDYAGDCIVGGLVALGPTENDWTTIKFWGRAADAILQWQHKGRDAGQVPGSNQPAGRVEVYIRMARDGDTYKGWWKKEEGDDWIAMAPDATIALTPPIQIGVYGGICAGAGSGTIKYEYFRDLVNPYAVEPDAKLSGTWGQVKSSY